MDCRNTFNGRSSLGTCEDNQNDNSNIQLIKKIIEKAKEKINNFLHGKASDDE